MSFNGGSTKSVRKWLKIVWLKILQFAVILYIDHGFFMLFEDICCHKIFFGQLGTILSFVGSVMSFEEVVEFFASRVEVLKKESVQKYLYFLFVGLGLAIGTVSLRYLEQAIDKVEMILDSAIYFQFLEGIVYILFVMVCISVVVVTCLCVFCSKFLLVNPSESKIIKVLTYALLWFPFLCFVFTGSLLLVPFALKTSVMIIPFVASLLALVFISSSIISFLVRVLSSSNRIRITRLYFSMPILTLGFMLLFFSY